MGNVSCYFFPVFLQAYSSLLPAAVSLVPICCTGALACSKGNQTYWGKQKTDKKMLRVKKKSPIHFHIHNENPRRIMEVRHPWQCTWKHSPVWCDSWFFSTFSFLSLAKMSSAQCPEVGQNWPAGSSQQRWLMLVSSCSFGLESQLKAV